MFFNKSKRLLAEALENLNDTNELLNTTKATLSDTEENCNRLQNENVRLNEKYSVFIDKDAIINQRNNEIDILQNSITTLNEKYQNATAIYFALKKEITLYEDTLEIGSFGLYEPQFDLATSAAYKSAMEMNYEKQKRLIKNDLAAICNTEWTVQGSKAEGKKMINQYKKLMLFAFNGESDACISKVKWNNAAKTKERIEKAFENINKLGVSQNVHLSEQLLKLKIEELLLTHEYELKIHAEKEEQRRIKEQMREEEKAQRDFERAQRDAEEEERRFQKSLDKAKEQLGNASADEVSYLNEQIKNLEQKLQNAHDKKERAISMAQQTKVGHIYVISNVGSFGEDVYKIGMTRRLDPLDRIRELGDASVPFLFDVHAIIYSENAPQLEYELHRKFSDRRLNRINNRREFFRVTLDEIESFVLQHANAEIQFTKVAEAKEYRETLTLLEKLSQAVIEINQQEQFPISLV